MARPCRKMIRIFLGIDEHSVLLLNEVDKSATAVPSTSGACVDEDDDGNYDVPETDMTGSDIYSGVKLICS